MSNKTKTVYPDPDDLREMVRQYVFVRPSRWQNIARSMGVSEYVFKNFINGNNKTKKTQLLKIFVGLQKLLALQKALSGELTVESRRPKSVWSRVWAWIRGK